MLVNAIYLNSVHIDIPRKYYFRICSFCSEEKIFQCAFNINFNV